MGFGRGKAASLAGGLRELPVGVRADYVAVVEAVLRDREGRVIRYRGQPNFWAVLEAGAGADDGATVRLESLTKEDYRSAGYADEGDWYGRLARAPRLADTRCHALVSGSRYKLAPLVRIRDRQLFIRLRHRDLRDTTSFAFDLDHDGALFRLVRFEDESRSLIRRLWAGAPLPPRQYYAGTRITPYAVDLGLIRSAIGSGDRALVADLERRFADELDVMPGRTAAGDDRPASALLADLVLGRVAEGALDIRYGYCLEILCAAFGKPLGELPWSADTGDAFGPAVGQEALRGYRVDFDLRRLCADDLGLGLPQPAGGGFGGLGRDEIRALAAELPPAARLVGALAGGAVVYRLRSWLDACVRDDCDLVCFPY